jgi:membrane peptidoglycan carboxypeptidase
MVLGTSALSLLDLTTGYIAFASGGYAAKPYAVLEIRRTNGDLIYSRSDANDQVPRRVFPEDKVAELNSMLSAVVKSGTGKRADLGFAPQGGKTGTNQGYRDAWYVGFTGHHVTGVWFGNDDFTPMKEVTGGLLPAPAWKRIMLEAERGLKPVGLAGIPYDESYAVAQLDDPQSDTMPPVSDETDQNIAVTASPAGDGGDVNNVLNGMFDLFEDKPVVTAQAPARKPRQQALVLPKANVQSDNGDKKKSLFKQIFGGIGGSSEPPSQAEKPKKKKKKSFLERIF